VTPYINDLVCGVRNWILKFADDTKIFGEALSTQKQTQLQEDINTVISWSEEWQMLYNTSKWKLMSVSGVSIKPSAVVCDVGVLLDSDTELTVKQRVNNVTKNSFFSAVLHQSVTALQPLQHDHSASL